MGNTMKRKVDLNCDLGESFGAYTIGLDEEVVRWVSSVNIACGWHAGDPAVMRKTVRAASEHGVSLGAHPGYQDLMGFGRREMKLTPEEAADLITYQLGALDAFARVQGRKLAHVKPHGALYNQAAKDMELARAVCGAVQAYNRELILLGLSGSLMLAAAQEIGLVCASEVFADRAYEDDGSLTPRSRPGSVIHDQEKALAQVVEMVTMGRVTSIHGKSVPIRCDSICVHGDNERAVEFVRAIRERLDQAGVEIAPLPQLC